MKQYLLLVFVFVSLLKAADGYEAESEDEPVFKPKATRHFTILAEFSSHGKAVPAAPTLSDFEKVCKFRRYAENFVKGNFTVKTHADPTTILLFYEIPEFRNTVRVIVASKLALSCVDPAILLIAQDIPKLRPAVAPFVKKLLKKITTQKFFKYP